MSSMNFLEKLLDGASVEWVALETVVKTVTSPSKLKSQAYCITGKIPIIDQGLEFIAGYTDEDIVPVANGEYIIFGDHSEHIKYVNFSFIQGADGIKILRIPNNNSKYIYYAFLNFYKKELSYKRHWSTAQQTLIPIPCPENPEKSVEIQTEIVRILDAMTSHNAELTAELTARKKQYNYYRDKLLSFEDGEVEWKTLEEISKKISSGGTPPTGVPEYYDGDIPWLRTQEVDFREIWDAGVKITETGLENSSAKWIPENCVIIAMYGATVGKIGINKIPMTTNQACANIELDENIVNYRYVFHYLVSQYEYIKSLGTGSQTNINAKIVKNLKVPIPFSEDPKKSLGEQNRIVSILDKFHLLVTSINDGLPREIELRQKQYAYYRDLLLSFTQAKEA